MEYSFLTNKEGIFSTSNAIDIIVSDNQKYIVASYQSDTNHPDNYIIYELQADNYKIIANFVMEASEKSRVKICFGEGSIETILVKLDDGIEIDRYIYHLTMNEIETINYQLEEDFEVKSIAALLDNTLHVALINDNTVKIYIEDSGKLKYDRTLEQEIKILSEEWILDGEKLISLFKDRTYQFDNLDLIDIRDAQMAVSETHESIYFYDYNFLAYGRLESDKKVELQKVELNINFDYTTIATLDVIDRDSFVYIPLTDCLVIHYDRVTGESDALQDKNYCHSYAVSSIDGHVIAHSSDDYGSMIHCNLMSYQYQEFSTNIETDILRNHLEIYRDNLADHNVFHPQFSLHIDLQVTALSSDNIVVLIENVRDPEFFVVSTISQTSSGIFSSGNALDVKFCLPITEIGSDMTFLELFFDSDNNLVLMFIDEDRKMTLYTMKNSDIWDGNLKFYRAGFPELPERKALPMVLGSNTGFLPLMEIPEELVEKYQKAIIYQITGMSSSFYLMRLSEKYWVNEDISNLDYDVGTKLITIFDHSNITLDTSPGIINLNQSISLPKQITLQVIPHIAFLEEFYEYPSKYDIDINSLKVLLLEEQSLTEKLQQLVEAGVKAVTILNSSKLWYYERDTFEILSSYINQIEILLQTHRGMLVNFRNTKTLSTLFWNDSSRSVCEDKLAVISKYHTRYSIAKNNGSYDDTVFRAIADYIVFKMFSVGGKYRIQDISNFTEIKGKTLMRFSDEELGQIIEQIIVVMKEVSMEFYEETFYKLTKLPKAYHMNSKGSLWERLGDWVKDKEEWMKELKKLFTN